MYDHTSTAHITTTGDHDDIASVKLDKVDDLVLIKVELDGIVHSDSGVWVPDRSAVVSDDVGDTFGTYSNLTDFAKFVCSFFGGDAVDSEATFDIV